MKRNVYMEFQVVCVHIQIFVQGLLLIKILLMEFSLHNIFLKLVTSRKTSIPDVFMMQTDILQVRSPHPFQFCML